MLKSAKTVSGYSIVLLHILILYASVIYKYDSIYRVFPDLWTLLQEVISQVIVIIIVHIYMCPILDGYRVMTA